MSTPTRPDDDVEHADDPYATIAELYDLEHAGHADDLDLYVNLAQMVGDPILEVGCGSGRVLVPLADAGFRVTGTDRSTAMLDRARAAVTRAGVADRVTLARGLMTEPPPAPDGPYGLAIVALNGFMHLERAQAQRAALRALHDALDPRGQLVLDLLNPTPDALRALDGLHHEGTWTHGDGTTVAKFSARRVHYASQQIVTDLWYDVQARDGTLRRVASTFTMRFVHRAELELMLELAGFVEWQIYGGYDLEPFDDGAERLIVTAEVTPS